MDNKDKETYKAAAKKLQDQVGEDVMKKMAEMVHKLGVVTAVHNTQSVDPDIVAEELYKIKDGILPVEEMKEIVEETLPKLVEEDWMDELGNLADMTVAMIEHYNNFLDTGEV